MNLSARTLPCACLVLAVSLAGCRQGNRNGEPAATGALQPGIDYSYKVALVKSNVSWSDDNERWQGASMGISIPKGSYVESGLSSGATLAGSLGDMVMIGEQTKVRLLIEELETKGSYPSLAVRGLSLLKGMAQFAIAKNHGDYLVETPSARISVKGTTFTVTYHEKIGSTDVAVREGKVEVKDLKQPEKNYSVDPGQVLTGVGTPSTIQRPAVAADSNAFAVARPVPLSELESTGPISKPAMSDAQARQELEKVSHASLPAADSARSAASRALNSERHRAQAVADSERAAYAAGAQAERDTVAAAKARARQAVDSTRDAGQSALDKERAKFKDETGGTDNKADDAFDELNKRKGAQ